MTSTFGNLESTTEWLEVIFNIIVLTSGLILVTMLIGNIKVLNSFDLLKQKMWKCGNGAFTIYLQILFMGVKQVFLHATTSKKQTMQLKMRNIEWWMRRRKLPSGFRQRVRNYERQKWAAMRGVDECQMTKNLPEGLRRDIKYHLCLDLVRQVRPYHFSTKKSRKRMSLFSFPTTPFVFFLLSLPFCFLALKISILLFKTVKSPNPIIEIDPKRF